MSDVKFCSIGYHAGQMHENAAAAYWDDGREDFHAKKLDSEFKQLAALLGYALTPIADAQADAKAVA